MKPLVPLAYKDADFHFPALSFLLPSLPIKYYDATTGRLILSLAESTQTLNKLQTLQDMLLAAVNTHHTRWNIGNAAPTAQRRPQDIRAGFQPMIMNSELHLYCPTHEGMAQPISIYQGGSRGKAKSGSLKAGKRVRIALRIHGISFHILPGSGIWTGKFRLQHKIIGVLMVD